MEVLELVPEKAGSMFERLLDLEKIDENLYRGVTPKDMPFPRIYGGQTISQALRAAGFTVDPQFHVHSLHSYFYLAGDPSFPILYHVDRIRDGRSFCSRHVVAVQKGEAIYSASISFQKRETGLEHQDQMPKVPMPEELPLFSEITEKIKNDPRLTEKVRSTFLRRFADFPFPIDIRRVTDPYCLDMLAAVPRPAYELNWMRIRGKILSDDPFIHACGLAFLSDWSLLRVATLPHGINPYNPTPNLNVGAFDSHSIGSVLCDPQLASIDHAMWFHEPIRADIWLLYEINSSRSINGRGLSFGKFYNREGKLILTCAQEGVVRLAKPKM